MTQLYAFGIWGKKNRLSIWRNVQFPTQKRPNCLHPEGSFCENGRRTFSGKWLVCSVLPRVPVLGLLTQLLCCCVLVVLLCRRPVCRDGAYVRALGFKDQVNCLVKYTVYVWSAAQIKPRTKKVQLDIVIPFISIWHYIATSYPQIVFVYDCWQMEVWWKVCQTELEHQLLSSVSVTELSFLPHWR